MNATLAAWSLSERNSKYESTTLEPERRFATGRNDAALRAISAGIGKQDRDRIARPRLNAELTSARGEAKHQNDIRL